MDENLNEIKVEIALNIINFKIAHLLKDKNTNRNSVKKELSVLVEEREKIYELDKETIDKVYNVYLEDIKNNRKEN